MEKLYYILDTFDNTIIVDNLTYDQSEEWLTLNGDPTRHILFEQDSL